MDTGKKRNLCESLGLWISQRLPKTELKKMGITAEKNLNGDNMKNLKAVSPTKKLLFL